MTLWRIANMVLSAVGTITKKLDVLADQLTQIKHKQEEQDAILAKILVAVQPAPAKSLVLTLGEPEAQ